MNTFSKSKAALITAAENTLGRGPGGEWTSHDFEKLSEDIFRKTGKQLSISTLKRIWDRTNSDKNPSTTTLNILAEYTGYEDWRKFLLHQKAPEIRRTLPFRIFLIPALLLAVAAGIYGFYRLKQAAPVTVPEANDVRFTLRKVTEGYPNTVIFEYDIGNLVFDSLVIQQSWDQSKRIQLDKPSGMVTSTYYYPGYFLAKLIVNNQILREKNLYIPTHGWQGLLNDARDEFTYLDKQVEVTEASISVNCDSLSLAKGAEIALANLLPDPVFNSRNFRMTAKYTSGDALDYSICKFAGFVVTGTREVIGFRQSLKGCTGDLLAVINTEMISGSDTDLTGLALSDDGSAEIELRIRELDVSLSVNGTEVFTHTMKSDIGLIGGVQWFFEDPGVISELVLSDNTHTWDMIRDPYFQNRVNLLTQEGDDF